jgi:hypothetical protein
MILIAMTFALGMNVGLMPHVKKALIAIMQKLIKRMAMTPISVEMIELDMVLMVAAKRSISSAFRKNILCVASSII